MGLWLKCPGCQAQNPLPLKSCPHCGQDLSKLSAKQRVYVMGPAAAPPAVAGPAKSKPPVEAAAKPSIAPSPEADAATKPAKKPKRTPKKKK
jgi:hypothetical protein